METEEVLDYLLKKQLETYEKQGLIEKDEQVVPEERVKFISTIADDKIERYRFRFWLESEQRWFYFGFETFLTYQNQIQKALDDGLRIYQSTGLKDIKGKAIFEGDIVKLSYSPTLSCSEWEVVYDNNTTEFGLLSHVQNSFYLSQYVKFHYNLIETSKMEVVGSIKEE